MVCKRLLTFLTLFSVEKSRYFRRDGSDVHTEANISLSQALLGGTIRVQGVYEDQTIQVVPGTSSHTRITLKGKGLKRVNSYGSGDHYVHLKIQIPTKLSSQQKALVQVSLNHVVCHLCANFLFPFPGLRRTRGGHSGPDHGRDPQNGR